MNTQFDLIVGWDSFGTSLTYSSTDEDDLIFIKSKKSSLISVIN